MEDKETMELLVNLINEHPEEFVRLLVYIYKSGMIFGFGFLQANLDNPEIAELDPIENQEIFGEVAENTLIDLVESFKEKIGVSILTDQEFEEAARWLLKIGLKLGWNLVRENARSSNIFDGESLDNLEFFDGIIDSCFEFVGSEEMLEERQRDQKVSKS